MKFVIFHCSSFFFFGFCSRSETYFPCNGGWVGMGGELFKDARNPWFVKNTSEVFYCLKVDTKTISVDDATIDAAFKATIDFWKGEFSRATNTYQSRRSFFFGHTELYRVPCDDSKVHLKIFFGSKPVRQGTIGFLKGSK